MLAHSDENAGVAQQDHIPRMKHHSELLGLQTSLGIKNILYNCVTERDNSVVEALAFTASPGCFPLWADFIVKQAFSARWERVALKCLP